MKLSKELIKGINVESEHKKTIKSIKESFKKSGTIPSDKDIQRMIASDHLLEDKNYYKKLKKCGL